MSDSRAPSSTETIPGGRGPGEPGNGTHLCPCGCGEQIPYVRLMCRASWYAVPRPIRNTVWRTWDSGAGAGTPEHTAAMQAAVNAVRRSG